MRQGRFRDPLMQQVAGVFPGDGAVIAVVTPGSPAEKAGLRMGDVVTQFAGQRVGSASQFRTLIAGRRPGETVSVDVWRPLLQQDAAGEARQMQVSVARLQPGVNAEWFAAALRQMGLGSLVTATEADATARGLGCGQWRGRGCGRGCRGRGGRGCRLCACARACELSRARRLRRSGSGRGRG